MENSQDWYLERLGYPVIRHRLHFLLVAEDEYSSECMFGNHDIKSVKHSEYIKVSCNDAIFFGFIS